MNRKLLKLQCWDEMNKQQSNFQHTNKANWQVLQVVKYSLFVVTRKISDVFVVMEGQVPDCICTKWTIYGSKKKRTFNVHV